MENLLFSLNATLPIFLMMLVGHFLGRVGLLKKDFCSAADKLVFRVALPTKLFLDMSAIDMHAEFDLKFIGFCAAATSIAISMIWILARLLLKDRSIIGEFVQASYRSSAAILGMAFIQNIYGTSGMAALMIIGSVPLFNIFAVLILTLEKPGGSTGNLGSKIKSALVGIVLNPIIDGIVLGLLAAALGIHIPHIMKKTLSDISAITTPLALLSIGATFEGKKALNNVIPTLIASATKLLLLVSIFVPAAVYCGFYDQKLVAILIMLGSPATPTCYIMAKNMGHEGVLSSSVIVTTTVLSALTLTFWIYLFRSMGYLA